MLVPLMKATLIAMRSLDSATATTRKASSLS
jgi:hypothetical protein